MCAFNTVVDHGQQPMKMHTEVTLLYKYPIQHGHRYKYFGDAVNFSQENQS